MQAVYLITVLAPLFGAIVAGLFGQAIGRKNAHRVTIAGVAIAFGLSLVALKHVLVDGGGFSGPIYTWLTVGSLEFTVGFLIDELTVVMMTVVTAVSLLVHIYTIGYMHDDPGYQRFFSYISLFTFAMLVLVMADNLLLLFFGWEAVGLVSYLLIGFWYTRESATQANLKAFLVNRVGDFGLLLGLALLLAHVGSVEYGALFAEVERLGATSAGIAGLDASVLTVACILIFIGAMGKSAQVPLHVWLPDSMEGPTPISALIHAATMVTAGIYLVARLSPMYVETEVALGLILVVGAVTAFAMGLIGLVQHDIKRVVAYSTLSQLGYMTVALGATAFGAAIFHLVTHAFFKALLFLAAGSVIIALHHEQDMRRMGGLWRRMPVTYATALIGALALIGAPFFSGFYSKDAILYGVSYSGVPGAGIAYMLTLAGVFITAAYTFRMIFLVFHGQPRMDQAAWQHVHETPRVVTVPLVLLAIPSALLGYVLFNGVLGVGEGGRLFGEALAYGGPSDPMAALAKKGMGPFEFAVHSLITPVFWLAAAGVAVAWWLYVKQPQTLERLDQRYPLWEMLRGAFSWVLTAKYGFDRFNQVVFAGGARQLGRGIAAFGDRWLIDGLAVNGSARVVGWAAMLLRHVQTGMLYHYAFAVILGLLALLTVFVLRAYLA